MEPAGAGELGAVVTNEFLWAQAGAAGNVALAWFGTDAVGPAGQLPVLVQRPAGRDRVQVVRLRRADHGRGHAPRRRSPSSASPRSRCTTGRSATRGSAAPSRAATGTMADYFGFNVDKNGAIRIVYNDTTSQHHGAHLYEIRQVSGKTLVGGTVKGSTALKTPMADESGDAQWPHYSPTGAGANLPQFDFTGLQVGQPNAVDAARADVAREPRVAHAAGRARRSRSG